MPSRKKDEKGNNAPYETDAQIAFLVKNGHCDFAISEDSDLLPYGCKEIKTMPFLKLLV